MNDTVTFVLNETSGFWDPYSAYFRFEVDISDFYGGGYSLGVQKVDNSAHNFIKSIKISNGMRIIE